MANADAQSFLPAGATGDWFLPSNWSTQSLPTSSGATAYIMAGKTAIVSSPGATANTLATYGMNAGLQVLSGGTVNASRLLTGYLDPGSATILIDGTGKLTTTGTDQLGATFGSTTFTVSNGGTYSSGGLQIAYNSNTSANLTVTGGSTLNTGTLAVGYFGQGAFNLNGGASATVSALNVGSGSTNGAGGSGGVATVSGTGTTLQVSGNVRVAAYVNATEYAPGTLTVADGASLSAAGSLSISPGGRLNIGTGDAAGQVTASSVTFGTLESLPSSVIAFNHGDALTFGTSITGYGQLTKAGSGNLTLTGANTFSAGTKLSGGAITLGRQNALGNGDLTLAGGDLHMAGFTQNFSKLDLQVDSSIYLEGGSTLRFNTVAAGWTGTLTLPDFNVVTNQLYFTNGLAGNSFSLINVPGYTVSSIDLTGKVSFVAAVPEPASAGFAIGSLLLALALFRRRRAGS